MIHIPKAKRDEIAAAFCDSLEGTLEEEKTWITLQQGLSKLVLYGIPSGITVGAELAERLTLWGDDGWEELLVRVESQAGQRGANVERENKQKNRDPAAARTKRLAREGARSKAVNGLSGEVKLLTHEEQKRRVGKLFQNAAAGRPPHRRSATTAVGTATSGARDVDLSAPSRQSEEREQGSPTDDWANHPLKGVSFKPMSGTDPSNFRPEHIQDLLSVRKRALRRRLFKLLEKAIGRALSGTLPSIARWILDTGVTFLEKPSVDTPRPIRAGEWMRKVVAKVLLRRNRGKISALMTRLCKFGDAIPGGGMGRSSWSQRRTLSRGLRLGGVVHQPAVRSYPTMRQVRLNQSRGRTR